MLGLYGEIIQNTRKITGETRRILTYRTLHRINDINETQKWENTFMDLHFTKVY